MKLTIQHINDYLLTVFPGSTFNYDDIKKHYEVQEFENKEYLRRALFEKVAKGEIARNGKKDGAYRKLDSALEEMDWVNANPEAYIPLVYPFGVEDNTTFGFDSCVRIFPKDLIVVAGVSNMGKTTFALNFLLNNSNIYINNNYSSIKGGYGGEIRNVYFTNEFSKEKFKSRMEEFAWAKPFREDGKPKFKVIERYDNFEDVIHPDGLNVIDWIELTGEAGQEFYRIGGILKHIQEKLKNGICLVVLQKKAFPNKKAGQQDLAVGGEATLRRSALYIKIDYQKLTVEKCKAWDGWNPNKRAWSFEIIDKGSKFHNIQLIKQTTDYDSYSGDISSP